MKRPAIYIMANKRNGTLYTGVTSNLVKRVYEHKNEITKGFTEKYGCKLLVYYEILGNMTSAISREKQIKAGSRKKKLLLIEKMNPNWNDLYETFFDRHCEHSEANQKSWIASSAEPHPKKLVQTR